MSYKYNPKTMSSGIICAIPHKEVCPVGCEDCFFQSGRSYLEPLVDNLPNMPSLDEVGINVVRVNDGNDSNNDREYVMNAVKQYSMKFYNTSINNNLCLFDALVVLTLNPSSMTDNNYHKIDKIPNNLMFVRLRVNSWNLNMVDDAINHYTKNNIPIVLTFMAYHNDNSIPDDHKKFYIYRKRTLNSYYAITTDKWKDIMIFYMENPFVYSCGRVEGERGKSLCSRCGNCIREFFNTMNRMKIKE